MQEWVKQLKAGDHTAYRKLYDDYARPMYNLCLRMTGNEADAHDVLQDGFVRIYEKIGQLKQVEMLPAWVKKVFVTTSLQFMKSRKSLRFEEIDQQPGMFNLQEESSLLEELENEQLIAYIQDSIPKLADRYRIVFTLHAMENMSHEEIAKELNIVAGTSRSQYLRAKQKLLEIIKKNKDHGRQTERIYTGITQ